MNITRNWAFAVAAVHDEDGVTWIAESRARTGTWIVREAVAESHRFAPNGVPVVGAFFELDASGSLLPMSAEDREAIGMSDGTYVELEHQLRRSQRREREIQRARSDLLGEINRVGLRDLWDRTGQDETTPLMTANLRAPSGVADIVEGLRVEVGGLSLVRRSGSWVVDEADVDLVDAAARAKLGL